MYYLKEEIKLMIVHPKVRFNPTAHLQERWYGQGAAIYLKQHMQQKIQSLKVRDICDGSGMLKDIRDLKQIISLPRPACEVKTASILSISDAAFNISKKIQYGKTGIIIGLEYEAHDGENVYHILV